MKYLGGPSPGYHYLQKVDNFDGSVESSGKGGSITLYWRAKFVSATAADGTPLLPAKEVADFATACKKRIESAWSGKATLTCAAPSVGSFSTRVEVGIVAAGQHSTITVNPHSRQSWMKKMKPDEQKKAGIESGSTEGDWASDADKERDVHGTVFDEHGKGTVTTQQQSAAAHEFGHAIGVPHPDDMEEIAQKLNDPKTPAAERKRLEALRAAYWKQVQNLTKRAGSSQGTRDEAEYGDTEEEHGNVMGKGNKVAKITGPDSFDPFVPFEKIAEKWGTKEIKAKSLNKWTAS
jgi:hypothetical protein